MDSDEGSFDQTSIADFTLTSGEVDQRSKDLNADPEATELEEEDEGDSDGSAEEEDDDGEDGESGEDEDGETVDSSVSQAVSSQPIQQEEQQPQPPPERSGILGMIKALLIRMVFIYIVSTVVQKGRQPATDTNKDVAPTTVDNASTVSNFFTKDVLLDMHVFISENQSMEDAAAGSLFWFKDGLRYGDWESCKGVDACEMKGTVEISESVRVSGLLFMHVYFVKSGEFLNFSSGDANNFVFGSQCLTRFYRVRGGTSIQTEHPDADNKSTTHSIYGDVKLIPYWSPKMMFGLITDHSNWKLGSIPAPLDSYLKFVPDQPYYYPLVYFNSYWNLERDYIPINATTQSLPLTISYSPLSLFRWNIYPVQSMSSLVCPSFEKIPGNDKGQDFIKMAFLDNGLFPLIAVSIFPLVHVVLSFLAFRNEIYYWSNCESLKGISVYSALSEMFASLFLLLYVLDVQTAFIFSLTAAADVLLATWKMSKLLDIQLTFQRRIFWIFPFVKVSERSTYVSSQTKKYDRAAGMRMSYVLCASLPVYIGYAAIVLEYKSWHSWTLATVHGFLTSLGIILMIPQIFVNHKFKSTRHLPWRALTYKAIDTLLDDACALVIRAPSYYRIGFFRYEQLYCIYLYQYWTYRHGENSTKNNDESSKTTGQQETTS